MFNKLALVTAVAVISTAASAGGLTFKAGLGYIDPTASKNMGDVSTDGLEKVEVSGEAALLPSFDYRFGNSPFSAELLLATPSTHTITALLDGVRDEVATVKQLPPTLTFKYNTPSWHGISANAGLGATVFIPYEAKSVAEDGSVTKLDVDTKVAPAAQLGVSWSPASSNWGVFADARYAKLKTKVTDKTDNTNLGNLEIDPVVYSIGVSHKF